MFFGQNSHTLSYIPPRLTQGREWYISYSVIDPATGKMKRFRIKVNRIKSLRERRRAAQAIMARISAQLALGWNPLVEKSAPKSSAKTFEVIDRFIKIKKKEAEPNTMRVYNSYVKIIKSWLQGKGYDEKMYICSFTPEIAQEFMNDVEMDERISARTFNNYRAFYLGLFNWIVEKGHLSANPFENIAKKPKKLTKKIRRALTDKELQTLFDFLQENNRAYMVMCLLCYCCFLRPKEISMLKCGDIDVENQLVKVREDIAKNDNTSYRTIPDAMMPFIREIDLSRKDYFVFSDCKGYAFAPGRKMACSRKIAKYWEHHVRPACDFPIEVQFYSLKDTGMSNMADSGVPITFVKQQADHSSFAVTSIYLHKNKAKAAEELKKVDIIHPKK